MSTMGPDMVIAIDGPSGAGKSTIARALAEQLGLDWLDTGAMYRVVTLAALRENIDLDDGDKLAELVKTLVFEVYGSVVLNGEDVSTQIRSSQVDETVSIVAAHPQVRRELVERQRQWIKAHGGGVVEGRDIATVVFPEARVKVYLTAAEETRAHRRAQEDGVTVSEEALERVARRDRLDSGRKASPLVVPRDSTVIDTTSLTPPEVVTEILKILWPPERRSLFYRGCRVAARLLSKLLWRVQIEGSDNVPEVGPVILAPIHRSNLDFLLVSNATRRHLWYMAKDSLWKSRALGRLLDSLGAFPVKRGFADRDAFDLSRRVLEEGKVLILFPEGTRRSGSRVDELQEGAAYLALKTGACIVPVGIAGSEEAMPKGAHWFKLTKVYLYVAPPIHPQQVFRGRRGHLPRSAVSALNENLRVALQHSFEMAKSRLASPLSPDGS